MTKNQFIEQIAEKTGIEKTEVTKVVEAYNKLAMSNVAEGKSIFMRGFGSFQPVYRKEKLGRNITENTTISVPAHYTPIFKPSPDFKTKVKNLF